MDITAVRKAFCAQLDATFAGAVTTYWYVPDSVSVPAVYVKPVKVDFDRTMKRGLDEVEFEVVLVVSRGDDQSGQQALDGYLAGHGATSLKQILESGRSMNGGTSLGGVCDDYHVTAADAYQWYGIGDKQYLGATFHVQVFGSG